MTRQEFYIAKPGGDPDMGKMQAKKPGVIAVNAARLGTETNFGSLMGRGGRGRTVGAVARGSGTPGRARRSPRSRGRGCPWRLILIAPRAGGE